MRKGYVIFFEPGTKNQEPRQISLEDARVASYSLEIRGRVYPNDIRQAPQNTTSVFGDPAG